MKIMICLHIPVEELLYHPMIVGLHGVNDVGQTEIALY
jgi:hypothetical protein